MSSITQICDREKNSYSEYHLIPLCIQTVASFHVVSIVSTTARVLTSAKVM